PRTHEAAGLVLPSEFLEGQIDLLQGQPGIGPGGRQLDQAALGIGQRRGLGLLGDELLRQTQPLAQGPAELQAVHQVGLAPPGESDRQRSEATLLLPPPSAEMAQQPQRGEGLVEHFRGWDLRAWLGLFGVARESYESGRSGPDGHLPPAPRRTSEALFSSFTRSRSSRWGVNTALGVE